MPMIVMWSTFYYSGGNVQNDTVAVYTVRDGRLRRYFAREQF